MCHYADLNPICLVQKWGQTHTSATVYLTSTNIFAFGFFDKDEREDDGEAADGGVKPIEARVGEGVLHQAVHLEH